MSIYNDQNFSSITSINSRVNESLIIPIKEISGSTTFDTEGEIVYNPDISGLMFSNGMNWETVDGALTPDPSGSYTNSNITVDDKGRIIAAANGSASSGGTVTSVGSGTGLTGGPITSSGTLSIASSGVTPGSYTLANIIVNSQGQITSASSGTSNPGTVTSVGSGTGLTGGPVNSSGTLSLTNTSVTPGTYTLMTGTVDQQGRITSASSGNAVTSVSSGTGLTGGTITSSGTLSIASSGVTAGTYTNSNITVNAQGQITSAANGISNPGTVTQVNTGTGLTGGPITSSGTLALANTLVSPGSYTYSSLTVDQQGRLTSASSGTAPVTQVNSGTGLTGGPINTSGTLSLANTSVTPGSYTLSNITVDQQGRITSAASGTSNPGTVTQINTGTGLTGGPITDSGTISLTNTTVTSGSYTNSNITVNSQGQITAATNGYQTYETISSGAISLSFTNSILANTVPTIFTIPNGVNGQTKQLYLQWPTTANITGTGLSISLNNKFNSVNLLYTTRWTIVSSNCTNQAIILSTSLVGTPNSVNEYQGNSIAVSADGNTLVSVALADGNIFVFTRSGGVFTQQAKFIGSGFTVEAIIGTSVAISADGNTLVVGNPINSATNNGAIWIFNRSGITWSQTATFSGAASDGLGVTVCMNATGTFIVAGAGLIVGSAAGSIYTYTLTGGVWAQTQHLVATIHVTQQLGTSLALSDDQSTIVAGTYGSTSSPGLYIFTLANPTTYTNSAFISQASIGNGSVIINSDASMIIAGCSPLNSNVGAFFVFLKSGDSYTLANTYTISGTHQLGFSSSLTKNNDLFYITSSGSASASLYQYKIDTSKNVFLQNTFVSPGTTSFGRSCCTSYDGSAVFVGDTGTSAGSVFYYST